MSAGRTARERVRAELTREIVKIARRHLASEGAAGLSLRAVAREMGMVSSAIYRYFPSRDDLLTTLIIDGYNALGEAVERADARAARAAVAEARAIGRSRSGGPHPAEFGQRWLAVCRAVRTWALAHPHEYALLYGSPVPGYQAPQDTVAAAVRDAVVFTRIVAEAHAAGALRPLEPSPEPPAALAADLVRLRAAVAFDVPDDVALRALAAWAALFGSVSFELFGQYNNVIEERAAHFEYAMALQGRLIGLDS